MHSNGVQSGGSGLLLGVRKMDSKIPVKNKSLILCYQKWSGESMAEFFTFKKKNVRG